MPKWNDSIESRSLDGLDPTFKARLQLLHSRLRAQNLRLCVGATLRGPRAQARDWTWSRTPEMAAQVKQFLATAGAPRIANLLDPKASAMGTQRTKSLPGQSWHQWGMAADVALLVGVELTWSGSSMRVMCEVAAECGLHSAAVRQEWGRTSNKWHVQLSKYASPLLDREFCTGWRELEERLFERFELDDD